MSRPKKLDTAYRLSMSFFDAQLAVQRAIKAYDQQFAGKQVPAVIVERYRELRQAEMTLREINARVDVILAAPAKRRAA